MTYPSISQARKTYLASPYKAGYQETYGKHAFDEFLKVYVISAIPEMSTSHISISQIKGLQRLRARVCYSRGRPYTAQDMCSFAVFLANRQRSTPLIEGLLTESYWSDFADQMRENYEDTLQVS